MNYDLNDEKHYFDPVTSLRARLCVLLAALAWRFHSVEHTQSIVVLARPPLLRNARIVNTADNITNPHIHLHTLKHRPVKNARACGALGPVGTRRCKFLPKAAKQRPAARRLGPQQHRRAL